MTTTSWKDASPIAAAIMNGEHDDEIDYISQACTARLKGLFRKGNKVEVTSGRLLGKTGVILKMNQKRASVEVYGEGVWNIPPHMMRVIS